MLVSDGAIVPVVEFHSTVCNNLEPIDNHVIEADSPFSTTIPTIIVLPPYNSIVAFLDSIAAKSSIESSLRQAVFIQCRRIDAILLC